MKTIRPFSNGTEFKQWDHKNCDVCTNANNENVNCHIYIALSDALFGFGEVDEKITDLIGFDERRFLKKCPFKDFILRPVKINTSVFKQLSLDL